MKDQGRQWEILLVEDDPADVRLMQEALRKLRVRHHLQVAEDGLAALRYLTAVFADQKGVRPDLILLDINLPRMSGLEVLAIIKSSDLMKSIPVIVMSSSSAESDVTAAYNLSANCYTRKPLQISQFLQVMNNISSFWMETALLPDRPAGNTY